MIGSWTVRVETADDRAGIRQVDRAAFGGEYEAELVERLREDAEVWFSYVAIRPTAAGAAGDGDGTGNPGGSAGPAKTEVVGHALLSRCHVGDSPALALGPCAVLPSYQNDGVGSAVIRAALEAARAAGEHAVVVLGHAGYYPRFGFERASVAGIRAGFPVDDASLMALGLVPGRALPSGTVRYPKPWRV